MVSKQSKIIPMNRKQKRLPPRLSITKSSTRKEKSVKMAATPEVQRINKESVSAEISSIQIALPVHVRVESREKGFLVKVFAEDSCPGLLVFLLEAFEQLPLDIVEARVSCSDRFHFEAVGEITDGEVSAKKIDAQMVKQRVLNAILSWSEVNYKNQSQ